jgi:hypothetical protein
VNILDKNTTNLIELGITKTTIERRMMKLFSVIMAGFISLLPFNPSAHAVPPTQTIAILDTAIDSSKVPNIIHEVCVTNDATCPNGQKTMEGTGAANVPAYAWNINGMIHGTEVALTAEQANPNVRIVFVRLDDVHPASQYAAYSNANDQSLEAGLTWVANNASKYNISAVSISQTRYNFTSCPTDTVMQNAINTLKANNVPVFAGVPDNGIKNQMGFPACMPNVISVGASSAQGTPYYFSNYGTVVQFMGIGRTNVTLPGAGVTAVMGTSIATPWVAALWVERYTGTWQQQYMAAQTADRTTLYEGFTYPFIK